MINILRASEKDYKLIAKIARVTFIESHGNSASKEKLDTYTKEKYSDKALKQELLNKNNIYYIIYYDKQGVGFSKIVLNVNCSNITELNITKMDRIYVLKEFYDLKLGYELLNFNINLSKKHHQKGMWLFVWTENKRAVSFYKKTDFEIVGAYSFKIDDTHSNPNHIMYLTY